MARGKRVAYTDDLILSGLRTQDSELRMVILPPVRAAFLNYALWITFAILEELPTFGVAPGLLAGRGEWFNPGCMIFGYDSL
ncbi:MAG: hypothetical protein ACOY31_09495 [Bacillota bacterium]